jgi:hypothetical protein
MKSEAHRILGIHLASQLLRNVKTRHRQAFLLGCVEPDKNPVTYLKGSFRHQTLGGHNWCNAKRYIQKLCRQLECKNNWSVFDYYKLGKLIHYIADGFTLVHNCVDNRGIRLHRKYEQEQYKYIQCQLPQLTETHPAPCGNLYSYIAMKHRQYLTDSHGLKTDFVYITNICAATMEKLVNPNEKIYREISPLSAISTCKI